MNPVSIVVWILLIAIAGCVSIYRGYAGRRLEERLSGCLHAGDFEGYRDLLSSREGKRRYRRYLRDLKLLDGAISLGHFDEARALCDTLDQTPMTAKDYVQYNMKALSLAVEAKDSVRGRRVVEALQRRGIRDSYAKEAEQIVDIYLLHKSNHIDELLSFSNKVKNPASKAMAYYRIARQKYYLREEEDARAFLEKACTVYEEPHWRELM
ncbi:MAG: hypothetical protein IJR58_06480, partial [Lachnospiraceae bacterium]|nr:hypothetical protein [Lachnospiraceae bacterium]